MISCPLKPKAKRGILVSHAPLMTVVPPPRMQFNVTLFYDQDSFSVGIPLKPLSSPKKVTVTTIAAVTEPLSLLHSGNHRE